MRAAPHAAMTRLDKIAQLSLPKKLALAGAGLLLLILLLLWLALPRIVQSQAERYVAAQTGHRLTLERPEFNPFSLALRLEKLRLDTPTGEALLACDELLIDLAASSLPRRTFVFDAIRLDGLEVALVELPESRHNWSPFLAALKGKDEKPDKAPPTALPRVDIHEFTLSNGRLDFADKRSAPGFTTRVEPLDLSLRDLSTLPDDAGQFKIAARTSQGARMELGGTLALNPLTVTGGFRVDDFDLAQLAPYLKPILAAPPAGKLSLAGDYRIGNGGDQLDAAVEKLDAQLAGLRLQARAAQGGALAIDAIALENGRFALAAQELQIGTLKLSGGAVELPGVAPAPSFAALAVENARIKLDTRAIAIGRILLSGASAQASRDAAGRIDVQEAMRLFAGAAPTDAPTAPAAPPWAYRIDRLDIDGLGLAWRDESVMPAAELALENVAAHASAIDSAPEAAFPLRLAFDVRGGGRFEGAGKLAPAASTLDFKYQLADLALKPAQPYLAAHAALTLASGKFASQGHIAYDTKGPRLRGNFKLADLRLDEAETGTAFLAWKSLGSQNLTLTADRLDLGELRLAGLDTQLIIDRDKQINLKKALRQQPAPDTAALATQTDAAPPFVVNIDRLRFYKGELDFADRSLVLPFGTRIHGLRGSVGPLSSRPGTPGQIELEGEVDDFGMARALGQVDLFDPTGFMDIHVLFRNVEMTRLTPYTATFAGRKIASGKLSLDLEYKIKQRQLQGENQIVMDRLTLGERVDSPSAKDLPLDLAVAILQDADGRIDLGLPVSGNLDDPEFSYGQIVWKALSNILTKIVAAPFRALGALLGGGGEKVDSIVFEPGAARPTPPEREKLVRLAEALAKRPGLVLAVGGRHAEADRVALQDVQLRRALIAGMGQSTSEKGDPGPLSTQQPKVRTALEELFAARHGASALAALKDGFRRANPGQMEESAAGKLVSRLAGLLREKKTLSEDEVAQLKGANFHLTLYERLRAGEAVSDERLRALGTTRGDNAIEILKAAGATPERLRLLPAESDSGNGNAVALQIALEAAKTAP